MSPSGFTAAAIVTLVLAWLGLVWAQAYQKFQDRANELFKDFVDSGALDAALARIDSQKTNPALAEVVRVADQLRARASSDGGEAPDLHEVLESEALRSARDQLGEAFQARESLLSKFDQPASHARWAWGSALAHMPCVGAAMASHFFLDDPWRTVSLTVFVVLASISLLIHGVCALQFGRKREVLQQCLSPRARTAAN